MSAFGSAAFATTAFSVNAFSFDGEGPPPPPPPVVGVPPPPSGGIPSDRGPTQEQIRRSRVRFGLESEVIESVAARQVADLHLDEIQRRQELEGELRLRGVEFEIRHLEELNARRQTMIDAEIAMRLREIMANDEAALVIILAASAI